MKKPMLVFVFTATALALPGPASAYVRTRTRTAGVPTAWKCPHVTMDFSLGAPPAQLDAAAYLAAAQQAGAAWTQASLDGVNRCSNVTLEALSTPDVAGPVGNDGHNRIIFRQSTWCRDPPPTEPGEPRCYDASALAITTVFQLKNSGAIVDADIEVNAVTYTWGDFVAQPNTITFRSHDFQGAITHEFGHVLGLDHTCYKPSSYSDGTPVPRPVDNTGQLIPDCGPDNPPLITDATMYVSVDSPATEVGLRSLSPDDVQGVCDIYPYSPNFVCKNDSDSSGGGCSLVAYPKRGAIAGVLVLASLALLLRRKSRF